MSRSSTAFSLASLTFRPDSGPELAAITPLWNSSLYSSLVASSRRASSESVAPALRTASSAGTWEYPFSVMIGTGFRELAMSFTGFGAAALPSWMSRSAIRS